MERECKLSGFSFNLLPQLSLQKNSKKSNKTIVSHVITLPPIPVRQDASEKKKQLRKQNNPPSFSPLPPKKLLTAFHVQ